jgi:hypothetical protein
MIRANRDEAQAAAISTVSPEIIERKAIASDWKAGRRKAGFP